MARTRGSGLDAADAARLVEGYERSGLTRREYCEQAGIPVSTFDYYRRRQARRKAAQLVPVQLIGAARSSNFTLVLGNGRRIESDWGFPNEDLARLVRVAEQA